MLVVTRTPWTPDHIARVEEPRLPRQSRGGYVIEDVQRQLDRIAGLMRTGRPVPPISTAAFRRARFSEGYAPAAVHALLAHVAGWQREMDEQAREQAHEVEQAAEAAPADDERKLNWTRQQQVWVREMLFARRTGGRAYAVDEVDDFLDRVLLAMAKGEPLPDVQTALFYSPRFGRGGYDAIAVDHFLDQLTRLRPAL